MNPINSFNSARRKNYNKKVRNHVRRLTKLQRKRDAFLERQETTEGSEQRKSRFHSSVRNDMIAQECVPQNKHNMRMTSPETGFHTPLAVLCSMQLNSNAWKNVPTNMANKQKVGI